MRKLLIIVTSLLVGSGVTAQNQRFIYKGDLDNRSVAVKPTESVFSTNRTAPQVQTNTNTGNMGTDAVTSTAILVLPNPYGYAVVAEQKEVCAMPSLDAVAFANRQDPATYGGGISGHFRYSVSTDAGQNWTTGIGVTNADAQTLGLGRYPDNYLFAGGTNPTTNDLKFHISGPTVDISGSGFAGQVFNTVTSNLTNAASFNVTQEDYVNQGNTLFYSEGTQQGYDSGIFWKVDGTTDAADDNLYVSKGTFNATTQKLEWTLHDTITATWNLAVDGASHWTSVNIAFSPDGKKGFICVLGDMVGGRDSIYMPVIWEYDFATDSWMAPYEVNINAFPELAGYVQQWVDTANVSISNGTVTTGFNCDLTVDNDGNPHIMAVVGPASSGTASPTAYSISSGFGMQMMDITIDPWGDWNMITLGPVYTFRESLGSGANVVSLDIATHLSRTMDGTKIFYTWCDTDTTGIGGNDNIAPNLWGRFYDVDANLISTSVDWTFDDGFFATKARQPKTSEYVFEATSASACGMVYTVPTTVVDFSDLTNMLAPVTIYYFEDVSYDCSTADQNPTWFYNCASNPISVTPTVTPAGCGQNNGSASIVLAGGVPGSTGYTVSVTDASGANVPYANNMISNVGAGIYTVMVTDSLGCMSETSVSVTNLNAPTVTVTNTVNPACFNTANGGATLSITGGTAPYTVNWSSGATGTNPTNLPNGVNTYTVTDAGQCITTGQITLTAPPAINVTESAGNLQCNGDNSGSVSLLISGGSGGTNVTWTPASAGTGSVVTGLAAGSYSYTVTDGNNCTVTNSVTITQPAAIVATGSATPNSVASATGPWSGTCTVNASGGTGVLTYSWSLLSNTTNVPITTNNPGTTAFQSGLPGGVMTIIIEDENGCLDTVTQTIEGYTVGIEESLIGINDFKAYPNPANTVLNVSMTLNNADDVTVSLVSLNGQVMMTKTAKNSASFNTQLNVANLASGMYFLQVTTSIGTATQKLIIE
ncbi:MAG: T9SS type A sorting domain-containing protein [Bacteroidia bacterium]|nr:T9SS type A sorting domain-containing protein [Bacteroidia bacterium]